MYVPLSSPQSDILSEFVLAYSAIDLRVVGLAKRVNIKVRIEALHSTIKWSIPQIFPT